ncbi:Diphosphomevalonate decarboxylase [Histomonas meleagridis]|uniref:Diphosphomevalonate decarboxylase n=1 Tax=Histomonas meleagridis TaxID=135588 RepID=UPI00355A7271|nr:Diphosphomevalonate decarboxylase [Histomonas meleagridis]KAH0804322.1 Diphosphomevalonate decarboxylase [Histomonas meleagridis]
MKATCVAHPNIALIKYWGKSDEKLITPIHGSLSLTIDVGETKTIAQFSDKDSFILNGKPAQITSRLQFALDFFRKYTNNNHFLVQSTNNFPTAAGFASSASGAAAFVGALAGLVSQSEDPISYWSTKNVNLSIISRQVSGSGCRSIYGGFVEWLPGDSDHSFSRQLFPSNHWNDFCVISVTLKQEAKSISSTSGMQQTCQTVPWMRWRAENVVPERIKSAIEYIKDKNFEKLAPIIMQESNELHANCAATFPPIHYLNDNSYKVIDAIHKINESFGKYVAAYSFDAGPNPFVFTLEQFVNVVKDALLELDCVNPEKIIICHQSSGIRVKLE